MPDKNVWVIFTSIDRDFETTIRSKHIREMVVRWENEGRTARLFVNETPIWIGYGEDALFRANNARDEILEEINKAEMALTADTIIIKLTKLMQQEQG